MALDDISLLRLILRLYKYGMHGCKHSICLSVRLQLRNFINFRLHVLFISIALIMESDIYVMA